MVGQHPTSRGLGLGKLIVPLQSARTDAGADGELNAYVSGATIILQMYSQSGGAWRSVTLS